MSNFDEEHGQILHEEERIGHGRGVRGQLRVVEPPPLVAGYARQVEQPECHGQHHEEHRDGSSVEIDSREKRRDLTLACAESASTMSSTISPGHSSLGLSVEDGPRGQEQEDQFDAKTDKHARALALHKNKLAANGSGRLTLT